MTKKVKINLNILNKKPLEKIEKLEVDIKDKIDNLNSSLEKIKISENNFDLTKKEGAKDLIFNETYFKNDDVENKQIRPIPTNFKANKELVAGIDTGAEAIDYLASKYKDIVTNIPQQIKELQDKLNPMKNWELVKDGVKVEDNSFLFIKKILIKHSIKFYKSIQHTTCEDFNEDYILRIENILIKEPFNRENYPINVTLTNKNYAFFGACNMSIITISKELYLNLISFNGFLIQKETRCRPIEGNFQVGRESSDKRYNLKYKKNEVEVYKWVGNGEPFPIFNNIS